MGRYRLIIGNEAKADLIKIKKSGNKSDMKKIEKIFEELQSHPEFGIGQPEELKYQLQGFWSRRLNQKDRVIYKINKAEILVMVVSIKGHYLDK